MNMHAKRPLLPESVTLGPLTGSRKIYVEPREGVRVPFREIALDPSANEAPVRVYDASGPYTEEFFAPDLGAGLQSARPWLASREGLETYAGRDIRPEDNGGASGEHLVPPCPASRAPLRGKPRRPVTQYEFARAGIITEEMIYVGASRESRPRACGRRRRGALGRRRKLRRLHAGLRHAGIRPRRDRARPRDHSRRTSTIPNSSR